MFHLFIILFCSFILFLDVFSLRFNTLSLPDEIFDITVTRTLTNVQTNEVKKNENNQFVFVPSTSVFDYLDACNRFYDLSFRIIRFKIAGDKYETLVTNLDENEFKLSDFKDLYHLRWNEETAFYYLKYAVGMLYFHCKKNSIYSRKYTHQFYFITMQI